MQLIVGLGNPGPKYLMTRHNIGFMVIDAIAHQFADGSYKQEHKSQVCKVRLGSQVALLAKPQTYMNLSGESVRALADYYNIESRDILVIHDDIDQPFLGVRFQKSRGHGGHNGIRSITQHLGTKDYGRLKLGVSRPSNTRMDVADYVLQDFSKSEQQQLADFISTACDAVESYIVDGFEKAATQYNRTVERNSP